MLDLDMSPYGAFIWPAWGVTFVVLVGLSALCLWRARYWRNELKRLQAPKDKRK